MKIVLMEAGTHENGTGARSCPTEALAGFNDIESSHLLPEN
jgi:hypothetical protein